MDSLARPGESKVFWWEKNGSSSPGLGPFPVATVIDRHCCCQSCTAWAPGQERRGKKKTKKWIYPTISDPQESSSCSSNQREIAIFGILSVHTWSTLLGFRLPLSSVWLIPEEENTVNYSSLIWWNFKFWSFSTSAHYHFMYQNPQICSMHSVQYL